MTRVSLVAVVVLLAAVAAGNSGCGNAFSDDSPSGGGITGKILCEVDPTSCAPAPVALSDIGDDLASLSCASFCESAAECGIEFEGNCVTDCIEKLDAASALSDSCEQAFIDAFDCYSSMTCAEVWDRAHGNTRIDSCTPVDDDAARTCGL